MGFEAVLKRLPGMKIADMTHLASHRLLELDAAYGLLRFNPSARAYARFYRRLKLWRQVPIAARRRASQPIGKKDA